LKLPHQISPTFWRSGGMRTILVRHCKGRVKEDWTRYRGAANVRSMIDPKVLDDLAKKVAESVPSGLQSIQNDLQKNFRATLAAGLSRLDLVTREEFDIQASVLARTREKLEQLERQMDELERKSAQR